MLEFVRSKTVCLDAIVSPPPTPVIRLFCLSMGSNIFGWGAGKIWSEGQNLLVWKIRGCSKKTLLEKTQATSVSTPLLFPVAVWLVGWWQSTSPSPNYPTGNTNYSTCSPSSPRVIPTQLHNCLKTTPHLENNCFSH